MTAPDVVNAKPPLKAELSDNYYTQHRNCLIFSVILVACQISGARLDLSQSTLAGSVKLNAELNLSIIITLCLLYSYSHFFLEWLWQARQQYNFGLQELDTIRNNLDEMIEPIRDSLSQANSELSRSVVEFSELSNELVDEHRNPPESKYSELSQLASINIENLERCFAEAPMVSPHDVIDYENGILKTKNKRTTKQELIDELYVMLIRYQNVMEASKSFSRDIIYWKSTEASILEDYKRRAKKSIGNIENMRDDLANLLSRYEGLSLPKSVSGKLQRARMASGAMTWIIGLLIPSIATAIALLTVACYPFSRWLAGFLAVPQ